MLKALLSFRDRYRILHLTWLAFFLSFVVWFSFAPLATTIQKDLALTTEQVKTLAICNLALTIPARIGIGIVLDRFGPRITFSCLLVFALLPCLATAMASDFSQLVWSSLATGIMGAGFVVGVRMVAEWFPPKEIGTAQGIYGGWGNFGAAAAGFLLPYIADASNMLSGGTVNWRLAIALSGIVTSAYGFIYYFSVRDTPPGRVYQRPQRLGAMEVTSANSFWAMILLDLGMLLSLGLLTWPLRSPQIHFLNNFQVILLWTILVGLYTLQTYKSWSVNREIVGSLNPFKVNFLKSNKTYPPAQRYKFSQVALLDFTYLTNFGSQLATLSMLPAFFEHTFPIGHVAAGLLSAVSYPFLNLISRPSGGLISDRLGSRKWVMTILTAGLGIGYLLMSAINSSWILGWTIVVTMICAFFVQAACGATFGMVPLIKREITGQIAGSVGAYGNVGGVIYLTIFSFTDAQTLFFTMGIAALICASLCGFFLKEPVNSFAEKLQSEKSSVAVSVSPDNRAQPQRASVQTMPQKLLQVWILLSLLVGVSIGMTIASIGDFIYANMQLNQIRNLITKGQYGKCITKAELESGAAQTFLTENVQLLLNGCQLQYAKKLAAGTQFAAAIDIAKKIPSDSPYYLQAQKLIHEWSKI